MEKQPRDWEGIEREYRAGILTLRQIGEQYGLTHGAIRKRAERDGWDRDLAAKIAAKAEALVSKAEVSKEVSSANLVSERQIVEINAQTVANVRIGHRTDIRRARALSMKLLTELEQQTDNPELLTEVRDLVAAESGEDAWKIKAAFDRVVSLAARTKTMKEAAETLKSLIGLEREAFGLEKVPDVLPAPENVDPVEGARRLAFVLRRAQHQLTQQVH